MAKLAQAGQLADIPLTVEAAVEGCAPGARLEPARAKRRRAIRVVDCKNKS
jgi:hypothetical protein